MKYIHFFKTSIMTVIASILLLTLVTHDAVAQLSKKQAKQLQKERDKEYKKKITEFNKEGWKLAGSTRTLEVALLTHYQKLGEDLENNQEFVGEVSQCQSINICKQSALNNALNRYASLASGNVKGRIESMLRADANMPQVEIDKFIAAYENLVQAEVSGALVETFSIVKEKKDGSKEYKTFFVLNEEKAGASRRRAMERSLLETKIATREAEEISRFVNEGFKIE